MKVYIMRGLPGSGKSTWVQESITINRAKVIDYTVCSADHYFIDKKGGYLFDPTKLKLAHNQCYEDFIYATERRPEKLSTIYVDNTNIHAWEISPYYRFAEIHNWEVSIVTLTTPYEKCVERGIHSVPLPTMWRMYQNMLAERLPPHWNEIFV